MQFRSFALSKPIVLPRKAMRIRSVLELPDTWKSNSTSIHIHLFLNDVHDEAVTFEIQMEKKTRESWKMNRNSKVCWSRVSQENQQIHTNSCFFEEI